MNAMEIDEAAKFCELCGGSIVLVLPSAIGVFRPGYWKDSQFQCPDKVALLGTCIGISSIICCSQKLA